MSNSAALGGHARGLLVGVGLAALNAFAWLLYLQTAGPITTALPDLYGRAVPAIVQPGGLQMGLDECADCPSYSLLNRGVMGGGTPAHGRLLSWANAPALRLASGERLRYGVRVVRPARFFVLSSVQWIVIGYGMERILGTLRKRRRG